MTVRYLPNNLRAVPKGMRCLRSHSPKVGGETAPRTAKVSVTAEFQWTAMRSRPPAMDVVSGPFTFSAYRAQALRWATRCRPRRSSSSYDMVIVHLYTGRIAVGTAFVLLRIGLRMPWSS